MVSIEDFLIKQKRNDGPGAKDLYLQKIDKGDKRLLRLLETKDSPNIKKFIFMHNYLKGLGSTPCTNINGKCLFCHEIVEGLNRVDQQHFDWLMTLDVVNKVETEKFNTEIVAKQKDGIKKIIFNDGKVFEMGKTFDKDVVALLGPEQQKVYYSLLKAREGVSMKIRSSKFYAPVFDYASDSIRIFVFSPSIFKKLEDSFTKNSYDYTSADFMLTCVGGKGDSYWSVSKKDSSPLKEEIIIKYDAAKKNIVEEIDRRVKLLNEEEQKKAYEFYRKAMEEGPKDGTQEAKQEAKPDQSAQAETKKALGDLF